MSRLPVVGSDLGTWGTVLNDFLSQSFNTDGSIKPSALNQFNVKTYGATGDGSTNDTTNIQSAITAANSAGGGIVFFPAGTYICNGLTLSSNTIVAGVGDATILKQPTAVADGNHLLNVNNGSGGSTDPSTNLNGIVVMNMMFQGRVDVDTFTQQVHLINMNAATRIRILNCTFKAWRGDAIYFGSGNSGGIERHNEDIVVYGCTFDGLNRLNRNGISVIDGTDVRIIGNHFKNCSREDMPGAIDLEPNGAVYNRMQNITIANNTFYNVGGNGGVIGGSFQAQSTNVRPTSNISVTGNVMRACDSSNQILFQQFEAASSTTHPHNIVIQGNSFYSGDPLAVVTISNGSPGIFTVSAGHNLSLNQKIILTTTGTLPTGLAINTTYYVVELTSATTFKVSATRGGSPINTSSAGSGTHTMYQTWGDFVFSIHGLRGVNINNNRAYNFYDCVSLGYTYNSYDVSLTHNTFMGCGFSSKVFQIVRLQHGNFAYNTIDTSTGADIFSFTIDSAGASDNIITRGNRIINGGTNFSAKNASHTISQSTNLALYNYGLTPSATHWVIGTGTQGTSTSTPGAVTTVSIAHGLGTTPTGFSAQPANTNARGAPAFHLTADGTNITLNFVSALTAATSYSWVWTATP